MEGKSAYEWNIVWRNVLLLVALHLVGFYGLYSKYAAGIKWQTYVFNILQLIFHGVGVTAGRHRLWSHRAYRARKSVEVVLAVLAASVYEQSIYLWCRDHRLHHQHSDTDADPYNSRRGFFFCHMGWICVRKQPAVRARGAAVDMSDLRANPIVMFEHRHNKALAVVFTLLVPTLVPHCGWGERLATALAYSCVWRLLLVLHATWCVNSFAHLYGYRPYDASVPPAENAFVAVVAGGEGYHNYHHAFPRDYRTSEFGAGANVTATLLDFLARRGLVYDLHAVDGDVVGKRKARTGDAHARPPRFERLWTCATVILLFVIV